MRSEARSLLAITESLKKMGMSTSTRMDWPKGVALVALVACSTSACSGDASTSSSAEPTSAPKASAELVRATLNPFPNSTGPIKEKAITPLGELAWIDSNDDGRPDTLALQDQVIVSARKATNGALYGLREVSADGDKDPKTGKYVKKRILIEQSAVDCQQVLVDLTGPQVWVSSRFPDENKFPGWVKPDVASGCFEGERLAAPH